MSIILHSDGLLGKIAGTVYGEQVIATEYRMVLRVLK